MGKIRVIHVMPSSPYKGGVETLVMDLGRALSIRGCQVKIYCLDILSANSHEEISEGISVKKFKPLIGDPLYIPPFKLIDDLLRENVDIVHIHNLHTLMPFFIAIIRKRLHGKVILQPHYHRYGQNAIRNFLFSIYKKTILTIILQLFDVIIVNSKYEARCLAEDFPKISSKIVLIPEEYSIKMPSSINTSQKPRRILYVGGLRKYKNVDILIKSFKILELKWKNIELMIIGDGPEKQGLLKLASQLGIYSKTIWRRSLPYSALLKEYSRASVVVLLSQLESFSRVAHEALAAGTPLVTYAHGYLGTLVERGLAKGVYSLNPVDVANAIDDVLSGNWRPTITKFQLGGNSYVDLVLNVYKAILGML